MKTAEIVYKDGTKTEITIDGIEKISIVTKDSDMITDSPIGSVAVSDTIAVTDDTPVVSETANEIIEPIAEEQANPESDRICVTISNEGVKVIPDTPVTEGEVAPVIEEPSVMEVLVDMVTTETMTEDAPVEEVTDEVAPTIESEPEVKEEEPKKEEPTVDFIGA